MRFQQLTGPVMAKGVEDTAFYRYFRLVSANEVGGDPGRFSMSVADFHAANERPRRELAGTHARVIDARHQAREDVRARIALLSEMPDALARGGVRLARAGRSAPRRGGRSPTPST